MTWSTGTRVVAPVGPQAIFSAPSWCKTSPLQWIGTCSRFRCSGWWFTILESWILGRFLGSITKGLTTLTIDSPHEKQRTKEWRCRDLDAIYIYIYINIKSSSHPTNTYQILHHLPQGIQVKIQAAWDNPNLVSPAHRGLELEPSWLFQPASLDGSTFISPVLFRIAIVLRSVGYTFDISWFLIWIPLMHMCLEFMCFFSACTVYHELSWIFAVWAYLSENHNPPHLPHGLPKVATSH